MNLNDWLVGLNMTLCSNSARHFRLLGTLLRGYVAKSHLLAEDFGACFKITTKALVPTAEKSKRCQAIAGKPIFFCLSIWVDKLSHSSIY